MVIQGLQMLRRENWFQVKDISFSWLQLGQAVLTGGSEISRRAAGLNNTLDKYSKTPMRLKDWNSDPCEKELWVHKKNSCRVYWDKWDSSGWVIPHYWHTNIYVGEGAPQVECLTMGLLQSLTQKHLSEGSHQGGFNEYKKLFQDNQVQEG